MFENIVSFFKKFGKKEQKEVSSKDTAKERLHLVLMQDRANVSIVPSTGKDKSYTIYIIAGTILIVIAGGIILIKKFVV